MCLVSESQLHMTRTVVAMSGGERCGEQKERPLRERLRGLYFGPVRALSSCPLGAFSLVEGLICTLLIRSRNSH